MTSVSELLRKKRQETADRRAGSKNIYKCKNGKTTLRILPGWRKDGDLTFFHNFGETWLKDLDGNVLAVVGDARITYGEDDVVRNLLQRAIGAASTDAQRKHYKDAMAKAGILVNAQILTDSEVSKDEAQIVIFSETQFDSIIEQAEMAGITEEFLSAEGGYDLIVSRSGKGFDTKYSFTFERKSREVPTAVLESVHDIDAFIRAKFSETERAVNALKSLLAGGEHLQIESRNTDYSGNSETVEHNIQDAEFNAVDEARGGVAEEVEIEKVTVTDAEIEELFN